MEYTWAIVAVAVLLAAVFCKPWLRFRGGRKREQALYDVAGKLGFSYCLEDGANRSLLKSLADFVLFSQEGYKQITLSMCRRGGDVDIIIADFQCTNGKDRRKQTVLLFWSDRLRLPPFRLRPETLTDKLTDSIGHRDVDFPDYPDFSAKYFLRGSSEERVRCVFHSQAINFLENIRPICLEGNADRLIIYRSSETVLGHNMEAFLEEGQTIFRLFAGK